MLSLLSISSLQGVVAAEEIILTELEELLVVAVRVDTLLLLTLLQWHLLLVKPIP
jgi:hypothetical protein